MKIEPMNMNVILRPIDPKETTDSGLAIPENAEKDMPQEGEVVALPETFQNMHGIIVPCPLMVGDHVLYGKYNGEDVKVDDEEFKIVDITHIRAKIVRNKE